jgi:hypothetical protein
MISTFILLFTAAILGILFPNFYDALSLIGSTCGIVVAYIIPGMIHLKMYEETLKNWEKIGIIIILFILGSAGLVSTTITILNLSNIV